MKNTEVRRRDFLKSTAAVVGSLSIIPAWHSSIAQGAQALSKNDRPTVGCIGVGGRGISDSGRAAKYGRIVAVCDADLKHAEGAKKKFGGKIDVYQDYRRLLDRKDIDVIINGTPDHWHTLVNVSACLADKDVYAEKPLTLTIDEGKTLRDVVAKTNRIVQVGTQQRSMTQFQMAVELVRNGRLGKLKQVWVALPFFSTNGGPFAKQPIPEKFDWDLYQGQTAEHDYNFQRTHKVFRWWYEYAGGIITDWGNHHVDVAHWGMDCESTGPVSVDARGLFPNEGRANCYNTPDRFFSRMQYPNDVEVLFFTAFGDRGKYGTVGKHVETTPAQMDWLFGKDVPQEIKSQARNGVMFIGDKGRLFVNRGGIYGKPVDELAENPLPDEAWHAAVPTGALPRNIKILRDKKKPYRDRSTEHMANFFECVQSRQQPLSTVAVQHRTITACHLTNLSIRLGRKLVWDPVKEQIVGDEEARGMQSRVQRKPYVIPG